MKKFILNKMSMNLLKSRNQKYLSNKQFIIKKILYSFLQEIKKDIY